MIRCIVYESNRIQKENSETLPFKYFDKLLPNALAYHPVYFGKIGARTEVDGLLIYDDILLILEIKAGSLSAGSPILDYDTHLKKLQELIGGPATQAKRFREYLEANKQVTIYEGNSKHSRALNTLRAESFRKIYQCTITLENLTHLAAKANKLQPIGVDVHTPANWSLALDDLRVYTDLFDSPLQFLHFLEQRELAEASDLIELNDELDHLGLYLLKNNYALMAKQMMTGKRPNKVVWDSFTKEIDKYYSEVLAEPNIEHSKPNQKMPTRIKEIIGMLEFQGQQGRARAASYILDGSEEYRQQIEDGISYVLKRQREVNRLNPFHLHGEMNVDVFCLQDGIKLPDEKWRRDYVSSLLLDYGGNTALVLCLKYDSKDNLTDVQFEFVSIANASSTELARIKREARNIKSRLSRYTLDLRK